MCANFHPASPGQLALFPLPPPGFEYAEAFPGSVVPMVSNARPRVWTPACFGLVPAWAQDERISRSTYNARSETLAEKPSFRAAWQRGQLCIIPVAEFHEPSYASGRAVRWGIRRQDGRPMGIAGLWSHHPDGPARGLPAWSVSMLTINADAHPLLRQFHKPEDEKRSIVILPDAAWGAWLRCRSEAEARALLQPFPAELLEARPAPRVGREASMAENAPQLF